MQPTEVKAKSPTRFNWDTWLCLDTIRPPILLSALYSALPLWKDPKLKIRHPAINRNIWQESEVKAGEGRKQFHSEKLFSIYFNALCFISLSFFYILSIIFFFFSKNDSGEGINKETGPETQFKKWAVRTGSDTAVKTKRAHRAELKRCVSSLFTPPLSCCPVGLIAGTRTTRGTWFGSCWVGPPISLHFGGKKAELFLCWSRKTLHFLGGRSSLLMEHVPSVLSCC